MNQLHVACRPICVTVSSKINRSRQSERWSDSRWLHGSVRRQCRYAMHQIAEDEEQNRYFVSKILTYACMHRLTGMCATSAFRAVRWIRLALFSGGFLSAKKLWGSRKDLAISDRLGKALAALRFQVWNLPCNWATSMFLQKFPKINRVLGDIFNVSKRDKNWLPVRCMMHFSRVSLTEFSHV
jgi:hypothetical protein